MRKPGKTDLIWGVIIGVLAAYITWVIVETIRLAFG
ncbi:hypothetical protein ES707_14862 [subsurface metagenome]